MSRGENTRTIINPLREIFDVPVEPNTPQYYYEIIRRLVPELKNEVKNDLCDVSDRLLSRGLITEEQHEEFTNDRRDSSHVRASNLIRTVLNKIKLDARHYSTFVGVLEENKYLYASVLEKIKSQEAGAVRSFGDILRDVARKSSQRVINILATGKLAAGKSALINALIGEEVAPERESFDQETTQMKQYSRNIDGILFNVWDSPGLEANTEDETRNMQMMAKMVPEADLLLFCIRMDESKQDLNTITHFTRAFGQGVWRHTVFTLTFGNKVIPARRDKDNPEALKIFFCDFLQLWREQLQEALREAGVDHAIAEEVNIVPIGYYKEPYLPDGQKDWLIAFWLVCLQAMREHAQPALLKVNVNRLKSVQEVPLEDYYLPFYRQLTVVETFHKASLPVVGGLIGGVVGICVSGPLGIVVGGVIGVLAGFFLLSHGYKTG